MKRVSVETSPELDKEYPAKRGTIVKLITHDRKTYTHALDVAKGEPEFPLSAEDVEEKFRGFASGLLESESIGKTIQIIRNLEGKEEISELFSHLQVKKY